MQTTDGIDYAANLIQFGRLVTDNPSEGELSEITFAGRLTLALGHIYQAWCLRVVDGSWEPLVKCFLQPRAASSEASAEDVMRWVRKGATWGLTNRGRLRDGVRRLGLPAMDEARFEEDISGLLAACFMCMGFLSAGDLGMYDQFHATGITKQVR